MSDVFSPKAQDDAGDRRIANSGERGKVERKFAVHLEFGESKSGAGVNYGAMLGGRMGGVMG